MSDITEKHIQLILDGLYMADRCRIQILHSGSISIGFGSMVHHGNAKLRDTYYGEWEIGSFHNAWRLVSGSRVLCTGDTDEYQAQISESELEKNLSKRIRRVYNLSTRRQGRFWLGGLSRLFVGRRCGGRVISHILPE